MASKYISCVQTDLNHVGHLLKGNIYTTNPTFKKSPYLMCPTFFSFIAERMCYFPTQFQCDSGHCIDEQFVCDGTSQCQDSSDEVDCRKYRFMKDQRPCLMKLLINYKCQNSISIYSQPIDFNYFGSVYSPLLPFVNNKFCETGPIIV